MKKLTIITVCYNEPNLEETCQSVVNQSWQDFEWVVIDGGSNQETLDIWEKYKYRIDKFISEPDDGLFNAMNKGIKLATGEYLHFLNSGDKYAYNDILHDIFCNNVTRNGDVLYGSLYRIKKFEIFGDVSPAKITKEFLFRRAISHSASFIKRELFQKFGLYDESYKISADYAKWFVFFENNVNFEYLPYFVSVFLDGGISERKKIEAGKDYKKIIETYFSDEEARLYKGKLNRFYIKKYTYDIYWLIYRILAKKIGGIIYKIQNHHNK